MSDTGADLPPEEPFEGEEAEPVLGTVESSIVRHARHTGVGVEDPNIVGEPGPTDVPPGTNPDSVT